MDIISIDSGSDADTFPKELAKYGIRVGEEQPPLYDIQGTQIESYGVYDMMFLMKDKAGHDVQVKRRLTASDARRIVFSMGELDNEGFVLDTGSQTLRKKGLGRYRPSR